MLISLLIDYDLMTILTTLSHFLQTILAIFKIGKIAMLSRFFASQFVITIVD